MSWGVVLMNKTLFLPSIIHGVGGGHVQLTMV